MPPAQVPRRPDADLDAHRPRPGRRPRRRPGRGRGRLPGEAVRARRAARPAARAAAPQRGQRRAAQLRRCGAGPGGGAGDEGRARGSRHPYRIPAPRTVPAQPRSGAEPLADLPGGLGLRLRPALAQPVGVHELPAHQAGGRRRATHPVHRARARLRPARCAVTLRHRVSVAAAVGVQIVVAAVSNVLYFVYAASVHSRADVTLVDAAQQASSITQRIKQSAGGSRSIPNFGSPVTVGSVELQLFLGPAVGQPTQFGPLDKRDVAVAEGAQPSYFASEHDGGHQFRVYTAALPGVPGGALVRTSRAADADNGALRNAALLLAGLTVAAAGVTYGAARLTAGRILRPIAELTATAERVSQTGDLTARLRSAGRNNDRTSDEVGRLSSSFDTMLAALDESVTAQRQLVADASHELRTPLTSLTTNLDLLEDGAGLTDPQAPALVRAAREQAGELGQLITSLLDLARYHESTPHRETVRLDLLTDEAVRRLRQRLPRAAIDTELHPCLVHVDPAAVDHAISNLVDNAIKWTPPDATVRVVVDGGRVSVTDHGPGIPDEDLPHIFERFYRAPAARGMPGAGLGLAIVGGVAHANKGTVEVRTGRHGSTFTLAFHPLPSSAEAPPGQQECQQE